MDEEDALAMGRQVSDVSRCPCSRIVGALMEVRTGTYCIFARHNVKPPMKLQQHMADIQPPLASKKSTLQVKSILRLTARSYVVAI
jgi:hypothetical protein